MKATTEYLTRLEIRMVREAQPEPMPNRCTGPQEVSKYCDSMRQMDRECFAVLLLSSKNRIIGMNQCSIGGITSCFAEPAEVMKAALLANAASVILVHNHPSGDPSPSAEDIRCTRACVDAGKILNRPVADHVVLGSGDAYVSLRESGMVCF